jgi:carbon storage regulator CsrA
MQVLARKTHESVIVGSPKGLERMLKVTVLEIKRGSVKLGFEAEKDCPIHRLEVWRQIRAIRPTGVRHNMTPAR